MPGTLVDTSVWVAAFFDEHEFFLPAKAFIASCRKGQPAQFCRASKQSWLRLVTTPSLHRLYKVPPVSNADAIAILATWLAQPHIHCLDTEPEGTRDLWFKLAAIPSASPKVWMDAYLAAFAIRAALPFATLDTDFRRFEAAGLQLHLLSH